MNMKQGVVGLSPNQDATLQITLAGASSIEAAANNFFNQEGVIAERQRAGEINGLPEISGDFSVQTQQGALRGRATFLLHQNLVYQLLGYGVEQNWQEHASAVDSSIESFDILTDEKMLSVQPMRLNIVTLDRAMTFEEFVSRYPSSISTETLMVINRVSPDDTFEEGARLKRVVGEKIQ